MSKAWFSSAGRISAIGVSEVGATAAIAGGRSRQFAGMNER